MDLIGLLNLKIIMIKNNEEEFCTKSSHSYIKLIVNTTMYKVITTFKRKCYLNIKNVVFDFGRYFNFIITTSKSSNNTYHY